ncbi:MAG: AMP-binding protein [Azospirillaceae bacterium]
MPHIDPIDDTPFRETLDARAAETPGAVLLRHEGRDYTIGEINAAANRLANGLLARGLRPGDRVALMLSTDPGHVVAIFATMKAGLVRVPINVHAKGLSLEYSLRSFDPAVLIADSAYQEVLEEAFAAVRHVPTIWRGAPEASERFEALLAHPDDSTPAGRFGVDDLLALTPSSGTTGAPKGVIKSDRTLRAGPMCVLDLTSARPGDVFLFWEPLHHGAGVAVLIAAVIGRITLSMMTRFTASGFWDHVKRDGVTHIHYLGGVLPILLKQPPTGQERDHRVRIAWGGGCPPEIWQEVEKRFGVEIREGYGLSELITFITLNKEGRIGSCGKPISLYDIRIVRQDGSDTEADEVGEIVARATQHGLDFLGYFRNPDAEREVMKDGWFHTGDLARRDVDGFLFYAGRMKEMVRRRGINISAWEVEQVVNKFDRVIESALVGVKNDLGDEDLKIVVKASPDGAFDPLELIRFCESRMPYYQVPRYVEFIDEFPITPTQRIRKSELSRDTANIWDLNESGYKLER